ncbi:GIY-YIG nuclease family protein [Testudinibacter sp. TR-2022]|uniref:GIY-YIG nuclease family protein n=1 Tax=Testudinibacter sp. TR-2022 TaxID=2585029 RepID=UPI001119BB47|nr:GIY-YIG nuclease family protein [Testudinibacter sp. TR-2022]TNH04482.1 GIY-YIG nuclease family protein [Pasteurellaceae bacterium Phil31]TNH11996.1 GIY-YIG nuclease family protein [Testudinibacter sp. TR-2022]TNH12699.1 GIY-YIG nuclease family protein [Testudinibacter sp. TR-2022]TNH12784.1 GIY-YIG nuclease family protein [Testudinibacter sp. TR-2022]TNH19423.1 GIY-YIG nuclease family protein [Testudinibacter sp. TR-2022]
MQSIKKQGYIYILSSKNSDCIKIGGTAYPPIKRIKEINNTEPYRGLGAWHLIDFRHVSDWRTVEHALHYTFRHKLNTQMIKQKELFYISEKEARNILNNLDESYILYKPKVDRMFTDELFYKYLQELFAISGLKYFLDYQGMWALTLFPSTNAGRYFTLSIGSHEVGYSTLSRKNAPSTHMILVDQLILDFPEVLLWLKNYNGIVDKSYYKTALPRAVTVSFEGDFSTTLEFLKLRGVRRALVAYWYDALFELKHGEKLSPYARFHNYNAVAKLNI